VLFADESEDPLFDVIDWLVEPAYLVYPEESAGADDEGTEALAKAFPSATFVPYEGSRRSGKPAFWSFMAGEALVLLCGSYVLTRLFCLLAHANLPGVLKAPLVEIERRRGLFAALGMSYFGLVIVFTLAAGAAPLLHLFYLSITRTAFTQGLPGLVAAYTQGHIVKAAVLTLLVNFFLGSILTITIPSTLIPGSGVLMAIFRPAAWGFLLAPVYATLLERMVPHSLTLLLEGTAYVMAAFFALLYPVSLFSNPDNKPIGRRYLEALYMNLKGSLLVLALLAVAAIYEAIEVILAM
jgi:hypothetical protein